MKTVPPPSEISSDPGTFRGALSPAFMKPENVVAVLVYSDGDGHWWGRVVRKHGDKNVQEGTPEKEPVGSYQEAFESVNGIIASMKAAREDPIVQKLRDDGIDPEAISVLRVTHKQYGVRWVTVFDRETLEKNATIFIDYLKESTIPPGDPYCLELAQQHVFDCVEQLPTDSIGKVSDEFLKKAKDDKSVRLAWGAVAFILSSGIVNIDYVEAPIGLSRFFVHDEAVQ